MQYSNKNAPCPVGQDCRRKVLNNCIQRASHQSGPTVVLGSVGEDLRALCWIFLHVVICILCWHFHSSGGDLKTQGKLGRLLSVAVGPAVSRHSEKPWQVCFSHLQKLPLPVRASQ